VDERRWDSLAPVVAGVAGGVALIAAVGYFANWALTEGFIGQNPIIGVVLGLLTGAVAVGAAGFSWQRQRPLAQGLAGSGLAILSFSIYVGHAWVGAYAAPLALGGLSAVAALGMVIAVRRDSQLVAVMGLVGGLATPLMVPVDRSVFLVYAMILNVGVIAAAVRRGWSVVPIVTVVATIGSSLLWAARGPLPDSVLPAVGLLALGAGWLGVAGARRIPDPVAVPFLAGLPLGLLAVLLPQTGPLGTGLTALGIGALTAVGPWAVQRRAPASERGLGAGFALALSMVALWGLYGRLGGSGDLGVGSVLWLLGLPVAGSWLLHLAEPPAQVSWLTRVTAFLAVVPAALTTVVAHGDQVGGPTAIAVAVAALGVLVDGTWSEGWRPVPRAGAASMLASIVAAGLLVGEPAPAAAVAGAGIALALSWGPRLLRPVSRQGGHWLPVYSALALMVPLGVAWRALYGSGLDGVVPVGIALLSLLALLGLNALRPAEEARQVGATAFGGIALVATAVAVPLQFEAQWLTIGWAAQGLAVVALARRSRSDALALAGLGLLGIIVVRLVFNPAVLSYHLTTTPQPLSWVIYGYGLPVLALLGAARLLSLERASLERGARIALHLAAIAVGFAGINLFVSHAFAGGETLSLLDRSLDAHLLRTLSWMAFGVALLWIRAPLRGRVGAAVMALGVLKVLAVDLWLLPGLGKALVLLGVALAMFGGAYLLQRGARSAPTG